MITKPIKGFGAPKPRDKWALSIYGPEFGGKTRLIATAAEVAKTACLAFDRKSKRTLKKVCDDLGVEVLCNETEYVDPIQSLKMGELDCGDDANLKKVKSFYQSVWDRIVSDCEALSQSDVEVIAFDKFNELAEYNLFSHFGRRDQIPQLKRYNAAQDIVELVKLVSNKHVIFAHEQKEIYKDTGRKDRNNETIREGTGKFALRGPSNMGYLVNTIVKLGKNPKADISEDRYTAEIIQCQFDATVEGTTPLTGDTISWLNLKEICFPE